MNFSELLIDLASGTNAIIRYRASKFNLTPSQALHLLSVPFDGISMSRLAFRLGLSTSTLTRNIQKLEALLLVLRHRDTFDKRVQRIKLTTKGNQIVQALEIDLHQHNQIVLEHIDIDSQVHLTTTLEKLVWAMECSREDI